jgi:protein-S-isoprenylcysteine O-methyltransferase Ste14
MGTSWLRQQRTETRRAHRWRIGGAVVSLTFMVAAALVSLPQSLVATSSLARSLIVVGFIVLFLSLYVRARERRTEPLAEPVVTHGAEAEEDVPQV